MITNSLKFCHKYALIELVKFYLEMSLSPVQQHLFSYFNAINVSSVKSALEVYEEILNELGANESFTSEQLTENILQINKIIHKYDLEIIEIIDEITCEKLYILINTADNGISQKSKFYDENTSLFFSKIVKDCVLSEEGHVSETHCLNLSSQVKMTKSAAQCVLDKLVAEKWLVNVFNQISLGMRTVAELEQVIKQHYPNDIKNCSFCKLFVIQGYICNNCKIKCHNACLKKYVIVSKSNCICPSCKESWDNLPSNIKTEVTHQPEETFTSKTNSPIKKKKKFCISDEE